MERFTILLLVLVTLLASAGATAVDRVTVIGLFKNKAILSIDGKQRLLKSGQTSPEGVKLVSANSQQAVLEIDGRRGKYGLGRHIATSFDAPALGEPVRIWPDSRNMYFTTGSINGYPVDFLVDTGATLISMNRNESRRLGIDYRAQGRESSAYTASGVAKIYLITLKRVKIGDLELTNIQAAVHEGDFPTQVLLGMSFLGRLDMARKNDVLELRKRP